MQPQAARKKKGDLFEDGSQKERLSLLYSLLNKESDLKKAGKGEHSAVKPQ